MLTNKQAIEYIDSILSNYNNPKEVDKLNPDYKLCEVWLSRYDIEAFEKAKDALRKLDKLNETLEQEPCEDCISRAEAINAINGFSVCETVLNLKELPSVKPTQGKMNAEETEKRGIEYCKRHRHRCIGCPLRTRLCIDVSGELHIPYHEYGFTGFAKDFNFMINEIYKENKDGTN